MLRDRRRKERNTASLVKFPRKIIIMNPVDFRHALHKYIDAADEQLIEALYLLLGDQIAGNVHEFDDHTIAEFHRRAPPISLEKRSR